MKEQRGRSQNSSSTARNLPKITGNSYEASINCKRVLLSKSADVRKANETNKETSENVYRLTYLLCQLEYHRQQRLVDTAIKNDDSSRSIIMTSQKSADVVLAMFTSS